MEFNRVARAACQLLQAFSTLVTRWDIIPEIQTFFEQLLNQKLKEHDEYYPGQIQVVYSFGRGRVRILVPDPYPSHSGRVFESGAPGDGSGDGLN